MDLFQGFRPPRKKGNTGTMLNEVLKGAEQEGAEVKTLNRSQSACDSSRNLW